jgi:hypothetical protein
MQALAARGRQVRLVWDRQHNRPVDGADRETEEEEIPA